MRIEEIIYYLETVAPGDLQENYDNAGLIIGDKNLACTGIIVSLDTTETVVQEAIQKKCNLIISHHPLIFTGLKKITGKTHVEKAAILAIKNDIAIYAIHTNLDNIIDGVNAKIADQLGLTNRKILQPQYGFLKKLYTFVPVSHAEKVRQALFLAGAGTIGNYSDCSFNVQGEGTFLPNAGTQPFVGKEGKRHMENEIKIEVIFNSWLENAVIGSLKKNHPYEEPAYDIVKLENKPVQIGSGILGELLQPEEEQDFLSTLKTKFNIKCIRHSPLIDKKVHKIAICGGAGGFLIDAALKSGADFFVTSDIKYHQFFDANGQMVIADIGHYESEQFTIDLLYDLIRKKFPNFAVQKTAIITNPVQYF